MPTSVQHIAFAAGPFHIMRVEAANRNNGHPATGVVTDVTAGASAIVDDSGQPEILASACLVVKKSCALR